VQEEEIQATKEKEMEEEKGKHEEQEEDTVRFGPRCRGTFQGITKRRRLRMGGVMGPRRPLMQRVWQRK